MMDDDFEDEVVIQKTVENPLRAHFRVPGLTTPLPTKGAYFPEGGIELDAAGEVSVLPMRAQDELLLASPDALMNNTAIDNLIRSCVPSIKMPEYLSTPDLDVLLLAIRIASTGENMSFEITCPECKHEMSAEVHLPALLHDMEYLEPEIALRLSDEVVAYLLPQRVNEQTQILLNAFKLHRRAQAIEMDETRNDEEKAEEMREIMTELNEINIKGLVNSMIKVVVPEATVTNREFLIDYVRNVGSKTLKALGDAIEKINKTGLNKKVDAQCDKCAHEWEASIEFNPATFFGQSSSD